MILVKSKKLLEEKVVLYAFPDQRPPDNRHLRNNQNGSKKESASGKRSLVKLFKNWRKPTKIARGNWIGDSIKI